MDALIYLKVTPAPLLNVAELFTFKKISVGFREYCDMSTVSNPGLSLKWSTNKEPLNSVSIWMKEAKTQNASMVLGC